MAGSRLDRVGTIFSRTTGLIKAGAMKYVDRPVWFDVYRIFPPKYEPHIAREAEKEEVLNILYLEDKYRALYFKKFGLNPGGTARNLGDRNFEEPSKPFVDACLKLKKENPGWSDTEVFDNAASNYRPAFNRDKRAPAYEADVEEALAAASKRHGRKTPTVSAQSLLSLFKEAQEQQQKKTDSASTKNVNDTSEDPK